jgi:hypothetical protein
MNKNKYRNEENILEHSEKIAIENIDVYKIPKIFLKPISDKEFKKMMGCK